LRHKAIPDKLFGHPFIYTLPERRRKEESRGLKVTKQSLLKGMQGLGHEKSKNAGATDKISCIFLFFNILTIDLLKIFLNLKVLESKTTQSHLKGDKWEILTYKSLIRGKKLIFFGLKTESYSNLKFYWIRFGHKICRTIRSKKNDSR
jgi:hypothetical protein